MSLGDYDFGSTVFFKFTTVNSTGAPAALSSGGVTVYRNGSTVPDTTGVTLTASFNGVTGLNHVTVSMATAGFYSSAGTFVAVISSGAASENLAGYVLDTWTIRAPRPLNWARLYNSTTAVTLSGTTISTGQAIASVATVSSTVQADVALWRGTAPSTLDTNSHLRVSTAQTFGAVQTVNTVSSTIDANVALWRGTAPSTLGPNANIPISTAAAIASVAVAADLTSISTTALALINAEAVDAIATDTYEEPGAGAPSTAASISGMMRTVYAALRNQITVSSSAKVFYNDANAVLWGKVLSQDSTGSTGVYTEASASTST